MEEDVITIDFKALFRVLWKEKWLIIGITLLFTLCGVWYSFNAREEFVSEGKILPELSNGSSKNLGGLASLAALGGIDLGVGASGSDAIRPDLYPNVISSTPFYLSLLKQKFQTKDADSLIFEEYYHQVIEENKELKQVKLKLFKARPNGVIVLNRITEERIKDLKERISTIYDKKSGVISISAKMPDPIVAAQIAHYTMNYLTSYVTEYRTEKLNQEVDFLGRKVAAAQGEFYRDQSRKAIYADQFSAPTIRMQSADIKRERLESEYKMSAGVYNELLKKYEEVKIRLQQETPVFQVLNSPVVPNLKSEPKKAIIIFGYTVLGFILSAAFFLILRRKNIFK